MFGFKRDVKKELNDIWAETYNQNAFKEEIKNKLIPACNKMWNKQKLMEETQLKIIKVLNAMADKLDEETVKTIKNIQKKNKGEK